MKKRRKKLLFLLLLLGLAFYLGNECVTVRVCRVPVTGLPPALSGLRVAVVADLHGHLFPRDGLIRAVRRAKPDVIAVCGDLVDAKTADYTVLEDTLRSLCAAAPTFYVTGNHEWARKDTAALLAFTEECGVTVLRGDFCTLSRGDGTLILAGVDDPNGPPDGKTPETLVREIRAQAGDAPILLLCHRNTLLHDWEDLGISAVLCGHGHGGVWRVPFLGGVFGEGGRLFPPYSAGIYRAGETFMLVSRGLGNSGNIPRIFNPPELPVAVLVNNS